MSEDKKKPTWAKWYFLLKTNKFLVSNPLSFINQDTLSFVERLSKSPHPKAVLTLNLDKSYFGG